MKISPKTFAYAFAVSAALLACNDFGTNSTDNLSEDSGASGTACSELRKSSIYYSYDVYDGPNDPRVVIIVGDVKDWMDEQFASGGNERKAVWISISDLPLLNNPLLMGPQIEGSYNPETGEEKWFVNGQEITYDELKEIDNAWAQERPKIIEEIISSYMASMHIPGEEVEIHHGGWKALMTAEEIAELAENNEGLAISFLTESEFPILPGYDGGLWVEAVNGSSRCP